MRGRFASLRVAAWRPDSERRRPREESGVEKPFGFSWRPERPTLDLALSIPYTRGGSYTRFSAGKSAGRPVVKLPLLLSYLSLFVPAALSAAETAEIAAARALFDANRPSEARRAFEALSTSEPANADVHYYLGRLAQGRDDYVSAVGELERAVSLDPGNARNHQALGDAYGYSALRAGVLTRFSFARKCLAEFQRAAVLDPDNVETHERLLEFYSRAPWIIGGGFDKARAEAAKIRELDAGRGHQAYASLYLSDGRYDLALAELEGALREMPDDYVSLYQLGLVAAVSGQDLDRGLASLEHCLKIAAPPGAPSHAAAQWRLGNILEKKGDPAGARAAYEAALRLNPRFTPAADALTHLAPSKGGG